ncbi:MAG: DNA polymerase III subunit delta [Clostridiales bacterium]
MSIDYLKNDIKYKKFKNVYLLYGPEIYLKEYYLNILSKETINKEMEVFNKIKLEGNVLESDIIDICNTYPIMSEKKLVIIKNSTIFKAKSKDRNIDKLKDFIKDLPEYIIIVFYEEAIDNRSAIVKSIKKKGLVVEFNYREPKELVKWITKAFKNYGKKIEYDIAQMLISYCEPGMNEILNEISKITLYIDKRQEVCAEDIELICIKSIKSRIFDLVDAVAVKDIKTSFRLLNDMINVGEQAQKIFILISKQFINMLKIKQLSNNGLRIDEISQKIKMNPYIIKKIFKQIEKFKIENLENSIKFFEEMDIMIKSGKIKDRTALELIVTNMSK